MKESGFLVGCLFMLMSNGLISCGDEPNGKPKAPFVRLVSDQSMQSAILNREIKYAVLLPEGYDRSTERYPVVYLLHGYGDNQTAWYTSGGLQYYVDLNNTTTVPMIYVMPEGYNTYYIDRYNGNYPYMKMFVDELVPEIDNKFRTKADNTQRAVMGYSMGGYGAFVLPALNPDVFSISIPLSMSFRTDEQYLAETQGSFDLQWAPNFGPGKGAVGEARLTNYFKAHSPFHFFNEQTPNVHNHVKYLIDCGDDEESLIFTNNSLHALLRDKGIDHEYRVRSGGHSFDYWKQSYKEALTFISNAVQGITHPTQPEPAVVGELITSSRLIQVEIEGHSINIMLPSDYSSTSNSYPTLYFINDAEGENENEQRTAVLSMINNAITATRLYKVVVVEIPAGSHITEAFMDEVVLFVDATYRTKALPANRVLMANGVGGQIAVDVVSETENLFSNCFLYNAKFNNNSLPVSHNVFYYLDITDDASNYSQYNNLFSDIRSQHIDCEYRVRQGGESFQDFLNGLYSSFTIMKPILNK